MKIFLLRHSAVDVPPGTCYGQSDVGLAGSWRGEFRAIKKKLPPELSQVDYVLSSPLQRCRRLAEALAEKVRFDERLKELNFGRWEGISWDKVPRDEIKAWRGDYFNYVVPEGESYGQMYERAGAVWNELIAKQFDHALIVTHGGVIMTLLARLLELTPAQVFRLQTDYGGLSAIALNDGWVKVEYINR